MLWLFKRCNCKSINQGFCYSSRGQHLSQQTEINLKHRNYENLHSKRLIANSQCSRSFSNSSWDKQPHQYTGFYLSTELWQKLADVPSGRSAGLNSPNQWFLSLSWSFRCALVSLGHHPIPQTATMKRKRGWYTVGRREGVRAWASSAAQAAILVRLGSSSLKP